MKARQDFADKWQDGSCDDEHQDYMDQQQRDLDKLLKQLGSD